MRTFSFLVVNTFLGNEACSIFIYSFHFSNGFLGLGVFLVYSIGAGCLLDNIKMYLTYIGLECVDKIHENMYVQVAVSFEQGNEP
jgi:hypothetical protein